MEFLAYKMVEDYQQGGDMIRTLDSYDFFILPIVNPDGQSVSVTYNTLQTLRRSTWGAD